MEGIPVFEPVPEVILSVRSDEVNENLLGPQEALVGDDGTLTYPAPQVELELGA